MAFVHSCQRVKHVALDRSRRSFRQREVVHWRAVCPKDRARVTCGHKPARPVLCAIDWATLPGEHHDEPRQVIAGRTEAISYPGSECRIPALQPAGIHHQQTRAVNRRFGRHGVKKGDIVHAIAQVWEQVTDPLAALTALSELPAWFHNAALVFMSAAAKRF